MAIAVVATAGRGHQVALPEASLPDDMGRDPGVAWIGEIAVDGSADEPAVARWVKPSGCFSIGHHRRWRRLRLDRTTASTTTVTTMASAVAVVLVVAFLPVGMPIATVALKSLLVVLRLGWRRARLAVAC
jgi:hypothetical protein